MLNQAQHARLIVAIYVLFLSVVSYGRGENRQFIARLPKGITLELVAIRPFGAGNPHRTSDQSGTWWKPDGTITTSRPDDRCDCSSWGDEYLFIVKVEGVSDWTCKAIGPYDSDLTVDFVRDIGANYIGQDLQRFTLRLRDRPSTKINIGLAVGEWQVLEYWPAPRGGTPYDFFFTCTEDVIMRCPEQKGKHVVAEVTQKITDRATRLVIFDINGNSHVSDGDPGGRRGDHVRYIHRIRNLNITTIDHLEFQYRPYDYWISYDQVSLRPGEHTDVVTDVSKPGSLLMGQVIPGWNGINIGFSEKDFKDRAVLLFFFDINQRPSRRLVKELLNHKQAFEKFDIKPIGIQAEYGATRQLNSWIGENDIPFPIGSIKQNLEIVKWTWGVEALPWLILADKQHKVIREGFTIDELEDTISNVQISASNQ